MPEFIRIGDTVIAVRHIISVDLDARTGEFGDGSPVIQVRLACQQGSIGYGYEGTGTWEPVTYRFSPDSPEARALVQWLAAHTATLYARLKD